MGPNLTLSTPAEDRSRKADIVAAWDQPEAFVPFTERTRLGKEQQENAFFLSQRIVLT